MNFAVKINRIQTRQFHMAQNLNYISCNIYPKNKKYKLVEYSDRETRNKEKELEIYRRTTKHVFTAINDIVSVDIKNTDDNNYPEDPTYKLIEHDEHTIKEFKEDCEIYTRHLQITFAPCLNRKIENTEKEYIDWFSYGV